MAASKWCARNPNAGGNGRKHLLEALEGSLRRLGTDYVDLYLLHAWDRITPAEEVMPTFDDLVRAGKVRLVGLRNVPAWASRTEPRSLLPRRAQAAFPLAISGP